MFKIKLFFLLFVNLSCSLGNIEKFHDTTDNILCRNCGNHLLTSDEIVAKVSPEAQYTFNDTLFNRNEVLVQVLTQSIFFRYIVITSSHSSCVAPGEWEEDELWFPDYIWKPCFCYECGMLIGWMFKHNSPQIAPAHDQFFVLVLPNLISENSNDNFFLGDFGGMCSSETICYGIDYKEIHKTNLSVLCL